MTLSAAYYIGDKTGHTVQAGESVYLYNTGGLKGYSIDFDKSSFSKYSIITENNRIYLGTLKSSLNAGHVVEVYFSTEDSFQTMNIQIAPEFLGIEIPVKHIGLADSLRGTIMFNQNTMMTGSGIDSIVLIISQKNSSISRTIFSLDSIIDFDYASGFFPFTIYTDSLHAGYHLIDAVMFSSGVGDTFSNIAGFYTDYKPAYYGHAALIYSKNFSFIEQVSQNITRTDTEIMSLHSNDLKWDYLEKRDLISVIAGSQGEIFNDSLFIKLKQSNINTMIFLPFIDSIKSVQVFGKPLDSMLNAELSVSRSIDEPYYLDIDHSKDAYAVMDIVSGKYTYLINRNNMFYCFYMPRSLDRDYMERIIDYYKSMKMKTLLGDFYTVEIVDNDAYNDYCVEISDLSGQIISRIEIGDPGLGLSVLDISRYSDMISKMKSGLYYFRLFRGDICQRQGLFIKNP